MCSRDFGLMRQLADHSSYSDKHTELLQAALRKDRDEVQALMPQMAKIALSLGCAGRGMSFPLMSCESTAVHGSTESSQVQLYAVSALPCTSPRLSCGQCPYALRRLRAWC